MSAVPAKVAGREIVMKADHRSDKSNEALGQEQPEDKGVSRRKVFGRFAGYTAPAMLALLASVEHAAASPV